MRITFTQGTNSTIDYQANNPANGQVSINNDANVIFHTATNLDSIEIQDGSTATVTLGFSLENIILTSGSLDLTVNDQKPCTGKLEVAKDTKYTLKSASGFDMTIISPAEKEYVLTTDHTEVTSKEVEQLINMTEQLASVSKSEDANFTQDIYTELREYDSFGEIDFLRDFMLKNGKRPVNPRLIFALF